MARHAIDSATIARFRRLEVRTAWFWERGQLRWYSARAPHFPEFEDDLSMTV